MKFMKRWLGIMMSVMLAAGSMQLNVYTAKAGETVVKAETDKAERTDLPEAEEIETEFADEGTEKEEDSSDEDVLEGSDEPVLEDTDAEEGNHGEIGVRDDIIWQQCT